MDLSDEFEEFLKKSAIWKSSGTIVQITKSHCPNRSHLFTAVWQRTVETAAKTALALTAVLAAVARYSADHQCYGAHISQLRLNCVSYHLWIWSPGSLVSNPITACRSEFSRRSYAHFSTRRSDLSVIKSVNTFGICFASCWNGKYYLLRHVWESWEASRHLILIFLQ